MYKHIGKAKVKGYNEGHTMILHTYMPNQCPYEA